MVLTYHTLPLTATALLTIAGCVFHQDFMHLVCICHLKRNLERFGGRRKKMRGRREGRGGWNVSRELPAVTYKSTISYRLSKLGKTGRRKLSPKDLSTIESYSRPVPDSPLFHFGNTAKMYTQSMTKLFTLQERHKIPILSIPCSICPQPSHVSHCCAALTYKLRTLTFLVSFSD